MILTAMLCSNSISRYFQRAILGLLALSGNSADSQASTDLDSAVYMMPMNCGELLPETSGFLGFFDSVAKGAAYEDRALSKRLLRLISLREKINDAADLSRHPNPVDTLIQKTICFYRIQKEPLKAVAFDDEGFLHFIKSSLKDLEAKVEDAVFATQFERFQKEEFSRRVLANKDLIETLEREASKDAGRTFGRISDNAKRKARVQ